MSTLYNIILSLVFIANIQSEFLPEREWDIQVDFIVTDGFNKLYVIKNNSLIQLDLENGSRKSYSHTYTGTISEIDATDPFRVLIFYKDFNQLVFLDKNLAPIVNPVNLNALGFNHVQSVCQSVNGGFWLFDQSLQQLLYFGKNLVQTKKSVILNEIIDQNSDINQVYIIEKNDYIYLGIIGQGILLFDNYGTYIKMFPIKNISRFQVIDDKICYTRDNVFYYYNTESYETGSFDIPVNKFDQVVISNKKLIVTTGDKVIVFKTNIF